ncbi:MAG TPA: UDP-N-acetylmuramoyl-L-alanyl-D-glutamate--2,6-diaminopimelate ligase [Candidatus Paceibacterota bacterium]|nr:UDP-N-acetylmuramoyl-L-alanyl-D-glutamate--2,6-diaminopimelate ligase [Candidatus Paceibacterota bacterium]
MFNEGILDATLKLIKRFIPKRLFDLGARVYHPLLAWSGALVYGFPSRKLTVIGVTGTKGKSTVVYLTALLLERAGHPTASVGSLGYSIRDERWPNLLKNTMPGRWRLQKFIKRAVNAGCTHLVMEVPSEGIAQRRHLGVRFDGAVFTGLHREHLEAHGSYEAYRDAKEELFRITKGIHVINADDGEAQRFGSHPAGKRIFYGIHGGELRATDVQVGMRGSSFTVYGQEFRIHLGGRFNVLNALAALSAAAMYGVDLPTARPILEDVKGIPGRMQWVQTEPFGVVVDYAHTPDSLKAVYEALKPDARRLLCVLGAAGGGRDKWKRKEFGALAEQYCDAIYLTDEDPYDENPGRILEDIASGVTGPGQKKVERVLDRRQAIGNALADAKEGDIVVITGKGSETSIAVAGGKRVPWSDENVVKELLEGR